MTSLPAAFIHVPLAHRALHDLTDQRPENSRAAIDAAIRAGYGIEIDLQLSADGQAMVCHDYDMRRLTGLKGPVQTRTQAELGAIPLTGGDGTIPTFSEVLAVVDGQVPLLVEIKDQDGALGDNVGVLEQATARALDGYAGPVAVMSFNPHAVQALARFAPDVPRGLVTCDFAPEDWPAPKPVLDRLRDIPDFDRVGASFISHDRNDLTNPAVQALRAQGHPVLSWTIRSPEEEAAARRHAENITFEGYMAPFPA